MHGNDRIYFSMGPKVLDMYKRAAEYQSGRSEQVTLNSNSCEELPTTSGGEISDVGNGNSLEDTKVPADMTDYAKLQVSTLKDMNPEDLRRTQNLMKKWFGETDVYSIYFAAAEQENGASLKKPKEQQPRSGRGEKK